MIAVTSKNGSDSGDPRSPCARPLSVANQTFRSGLLRSVFDPQRKLTSSRQVFHSKPWMEYATLVLDECEAVTAPTGLIMYSINGKPCIVTE
jgi:hypothetical protein